MIPDYERNGRPVVIVEQNLDGKAGDVAGRRSRFFEEYGRRGGGSSVGTPMVLIDGGHDITFGAKGDYRAEYGSMIEASLGRPPTAELGAYWRRIGTDMVELQLDLTNHGAGALDPFDPDNQANVVVLFMDSEMDVWVNGTSRWGKRVPLADVVGSGESLRMDIALEGIEGVDYEEPTLKVIAMLEHRTPDGWDQANAVLAQPGERPFDPRKPPTVALVEPSADDEYVMGDPVPMLAEVDDEDGRVVEVGFYVGPTRVGEAFAPPWEFTWTAAGTGTKVLTARAKDDSGLSTTSADVPIRVRLTRPPTATPDPDAPTATPEPTSGPGLEWTAFLPYAIR